MTADDDTDFGRELIASLQEAAAILHNKAEPARVYLAPDVPDVRAIREALGLSRESFAAQFGLKVAAVRDWEQGLRKPDPAARTLLKIIQRNPQAVRDAVAA